jgi:hypothetical protein
MKEFTQLSKHGNSKFRYFQLCQGNVVASFLAEQFNSACEEKGITHAAGQPRPDLVYMPIWTASWDLPKGRCNHHVSYAACSGSDLC